jgi:Exonuclease
MCWRRPLCSGRTRSSCAAPQELCPSAKCKELGCFGGPRCTCRISSTVSTGSSPSTRTTGKRTPDAEFIHKQPLAWRAPGIIIEVGFVEMLREGEGWRKGETWSSRVNPDGPIDPEAIKIHRIRPADLKNAPRFPNNPAENERLRWRLADRGPRLQERARAPTQAR